MPEDQELILLSELIPGTSYFTVWTWVKRGRKAIDGSIQKLVAIKTPSGLATTRLELKNFHKRLNGMNVESSPALLIASLGQAQATPSQTKQA